MFNRSHMPRPRAPGSRSDREGGQLLVIFAMAIIGLIGMTGLIIDGGDTFLQRRDQQNAADVAAMAAGYAALNSQDYNAAAQAVAATNGYTNGTGGVTVTVTAGSGTYTVDITRPHQNYFAGVLGFASWNVSTTATVQAGIPNGAFGAMPIIFNEKAFGKAANKSQNTPQNFDEPAVGGEDVPQTDSGFNWTVFCTANGNPCNGDSSTVDSLINQDGTSTVVKLNDLIGPLNSGSHTTLFDSLAGKVGTAYPVAIVNDDGAMVGWAWFHLTGSVGGSTKQISGWFEDQVNAPPLLVVQGGGTAGGVYGGYSVDLIN